MTFLGIDIGTSAVRVVLVDEDDTVRAEAAVAVPTVYPEPGRAEQEPENWWGSAQLAIDDVRRAEGEGFRYGWTFDLSLELRPVFKSSWKCPGLSPGNRRLISSEGHFGSTKKRSTAKSLRRSIING